MFKNRHNFVIAERREWWGGIRMSKSDHCDGKDGGMKEVENWRKF